MYIARFEFCGEQWVQAYLRLRLCESSASGTLWSNLLGRLVAGLIDHPRLRFGYRISLTEDTLERAIFVLAKVEDEEQLRRGIASFTRLNVVNDDSVQIPRSRQEYDEWATAFPRHRIPVAAPLYNLEHDLWVACEFNGRSIVDKLFAEAAARGCDLCYHANFEPLTIEPSLRREARRNAARISSLAGAPEGLGEAQELLARRLDTAVYLADELFGTSSTTGVDWLSAALRRYFSEAYGEWRFEIPEFSADEDLHELSLLAMRQRSALEELSLQEICSASLQEEDLLSLLSWCPVQEVYKSRGVSNSRQEETFSREPKETVRVEWPRDTPAPEENDETGYIFISYKRGDNLRIAPVLRKVKEWGYRIWYDNGIPGGSEWDAVIEERLEKCQLVLVFVSQEAMGSRYVRREVKFADVLKKAIIPVQLETVKWAHGMGMLLTQLQLVDGSTLEGVDQLKKAIQYALDRGSVPRDRM